MGTVKIGTKKIGNASPCYISFEVGGTWQNFDDAKKLIQASANAHVDGIKFQTFLPGDSDRMIEQKNLEVNFKTFSEKKKERVIDVFKRRELNQNQWKELISFSHELGLAFISTPVFPETVDFLIKSRVDAIKIAKGDINNVLLIDYVASKGIPIILDGREKFADVDIAIKICEKYENYQIVIMHCPSGYPAENAGIHLKAISEICSKYNYPVGFADHSPGDMMNYAALAMGANMLEKTITSDKKIVQVEHYMSLELHEIESFVQNIRILEQAMGDPNILYTSRVNEEVRRSLVAKKHIKKGEKITFDSLDYKRPGNLGISVSEGHKILNKIMKNDIKQGEFFTWEMIDV